MVMAQLTVGLTGSDGFMGKHLLKYFDKKNNIKVICFKGRLNRLEDIDDFFNQTKIDVVIHLAGKFFGDYNCLIENNLIATKNILEGMKNHHVERIVYASTGGVYGEPLNNIESFEQDELKPNTEYGLVKMFCEDTIRYYNQVFGVKYLIFRFPNVYGPGNDKGVICSFIDGIKKNKKITVNGDGNQSRNFLHVSDACKSIWLAVNSRITGEFNISNDKKVTLNELINELTKKYQFEVEYKESNNNLKNLLLNTRRSESELGFTPSVVNIKIDI